MGGLAVIRALAGWRAHCKAIKGRDYYRQRFMESVNDAFVVGLCLAVCGLMLLGSVIVAVIR